VPRGRSGVMGLVLNYLSFVLSASVTGLLGLRGRYDLVFVFASSPITVCLPAILVAKTRRIPLYLWVLDLWPESVFDASRIRSRAAYGLLSGMVRFIYRQCERIFISSRSFKSSLMTRGVPESRIEYMPNWAEDLFLRNGVRDGAGYASLLPEGFKVMFAGNIGEAQDFESVLKAVELLRDRRDIQWIVVGDGRKRAWVEREIRDRGLSGSILLLGRFPVDAMPALYSLADVMLVTLKRKEIFSLTVPAKIQSYLAGGRPVVTMLDGEGSGIVAEAKAGLTCPAGDHAALAANILKLRGMGTAELKGMAANALAYYKRHFDKDAILTRAEAIFRSGKAGK
jgi:colanic acid biosynthesis glycosyl transferase WcaI